MASPSVVVLGGGLSGVATAYTLARAGITDVTIVERGPTLGGLAGSFEQEGHFYPLGYHHILHRDHAGSRNYSPGTVRDAADQASR